MRLWHRDLIPYLPRQQLLAQWRECCAICSNWANKGTPNHLLVNKVIEYSPIEFVEYSMMVTEELEKRGYKISKKSKKNFGDNYNRLTHHHIYNTKIFKNWHNDRYLKQCLFNLQEKYDCGGISEEEWLKISDEFEKYLKSNSELEKENTELKTNFKIAKDNEYEYSSLLTEAKEIIKDLLNIPFANNEEVYADVTSHLDRAEQFLNGDGCPDVLCEDCTKEDCTVRKLGLVPTKEIEK